MPRHTNNRECPPTGSSQSAVLTRARRSEQAKLNFKSATRPARMVTKLKSSSSSDRSKSKYSGDEYEEVEPERSVIISGSDEDASVGEVTIICGQPASPDPPGASDGISHMQAQALCSSSPGLEQQRKILDDILARSDDLGFVSQVQLREALASQAALYENKLTEAVGDINKKLLPGNLSSVISDMFKFGNLKADDVVRGVVRAFRGDLMLLSRKEKLRKIRDKARTLIGSCGFDVVMGAIDQAICNVSVDVDAEIKLYDLSGEPGSSSQGDSTAQQKKRIIDELSGWSDGDLEKLKQYTRRIFEDKENYTHDKLIADAVDKRKRAHPEGRTPSSEVERRETRKFRAPNKRAIKDTRQGREPSSFQHLERRESAFPSARRNHSRRSRMSVSPEDRTTRTHPAAPQWNQGRHSGVTGPRRGGVDHRSRERPQWHENSYRGRRDFSRGPQGRGRSGQWREG